MAAPKNIAGLQTTLSYQFVHTDLLEQALTHSSHARELDAMPPEFGRAGDGGRSRIRDNEQLEFLGDSVLNLVTTEELFQRFPGLREGSLSKMRAHLVSEKHLIRVALKLELGQYLRLGRGEEKSGGRQKPALLVDALEAILAAMYLDGRIEVARRLILEHIILPELEPLTSDGGSLPITDFKSALQERLQATGFSQPTYVLVKEYGPEHNKTFTVEARLPSPNPSNAQDFVGRSEGNTKKDAEQGAARELLNHMASLPESATAKLRIKASTLARASDESHG